MFLFGLFFGNRFSLGRDKRKEFNNDVQPIRAALLNARGNWNSNPLDVVRIDLLNNHLRFWQRPGFRRAIERYEQCKKDGVLEIDATYGTATYDPVHLTARIDELLSYAKLR